MRGANTRVSNSAQLLRVEWVRGWVEFELGMNIVRKRGMRVALSYCVDYETSTLLPSSPISATLFDPVRTKMNTMNWWIKR